MRLWRTIIALFRPHVRREIFRYHDGLQTRYADPLRLLGALDERGDWRAYVQRAVLSVDVDPTKLSPVLAAQVADKPRLVRDIAAVVQEVFGVTALGTDTKGKPAGLTDLECVGILTDFMNWCAATSEHYRPLANSPARPAPFPADSDTGEYAACTSTDT